MIYNSNRDPAKQPAITPASLIPHAQPRRRPDDGSVKRSPKRLARDYQKLVAVLAKVRR